MKNPLSNLLKNLPKKVKEPANNILDQNYREIARKALIKELDIIEEIKFSVNYNPNQLANLIEEEVYELTGRTLKNQKLYKDKIYKYIINLISGKRQSLVRTALKSGRLTVKHFCSLSDQVFKNFLFKQFEDSTYLDKLISEKTLVSRQEFLKKISMKRMKKNLMVNDEKSSELTIKDSSNYDFSNNNLTTKSRESETYKLSETSKLINREYNSDNFKNFIKEKVNFYKKENSELIEKIFNLENERNSLKQHYEILKEQNTELLEERTKTYDNYGYIKEDIHRLFVIESNNTIDLKDREIALLNRHIETLLKKIEDYENKLKSVINDNKSYRDEVERNLNFYKKSRNSCEIEINNVDKLKNEENIYVLEKYNEEQSSKKKKFSENVGNEKKIEMLENPHEFANRNNNLIKNDEETFSKSLELIEKENNLKLKFENDYQISENFHNKTLTKPDDKLLNTNIIIKENETLIKTEMSTSDNILSERENLLNNGISIYKSEAIFKQLNDVIILSDPLENKYKDLIDISPKEIPPENCFKSVKDNFSENLQLFADFNSNDFLDNIFDKLSKE